MESELDTPNPGLLGSIKNFYYSLEDKYYSFMDNLQDKGIPSYSAFVNPIENLKIPSFPVFAVLLLAILGAAIFGVASLASPTQSVTLSVNLESKGTPVEGLSVTLMDADKELQTIQTDSDGTAYFDSVPLKKGIQVKVEDANYNPILQTLELSTEETNSLSLSLEPRGTFEAPTQDFLVKVLDDSGAPISDAAVTFQELGTDQTNTIQTTTDGSAVIKLSDNNKLLKISVTADGYFQDDRSLKATAGQTEFKLQRKAQKTPDEGGTKNEKTSISVKVTDEQGNAIPSTITLILQGSPTPLDAAKTESGTAIFDVDSGATVYATANADGYQNAQSEFITTDLNQINELTITLQNQTNTQTPTAQIKITNSDGQPLENTDVSLYSANSNNYITSAQTDSDGLAELELSNQDAHYITAYLEGYLPLVTNINPGANEFKLEQTTTANSANVDIEVINRKSQTQSGVQIDILDSNGRFAGLPTQITGQAGIASFSGLPLDVQMRARAMQDSVTKDSDVFILAAGDEDRKVQMQLPQATGKIKLNVTNLLDYSPIPGALIQAYEETTSGEKISQCTTTNNECTLEAYSNTQVILVASAAGFEGFTSAPLVLSTNEKINKTILLMPSEFKNNIQIKLLAITDENGRDVTSQTQLSKAKTYTAHLAANFPTSQTQGIYLRLGDENTNAQDDTAAITNTEVTPNTIANPILSSSQTYSPNCDAQTTQEEIDSTKLRKWTQVEYTGITGTVELTAQIQVSPSAKAGDKITLNYRSFARSATGKVARAPFDEDLQNEQNSTKGECQAKLLTKQYEATDGTFICNDAGSACIEVTFQNLEDGQTFQTPYTATLNKPFILNYKVKNFESLEPTSAYLKVTSKGKQVQIQDFAGDGTPTFNTLKQTSSISLEREDQFANVIKILLAEQKDEYNGAIKILPLVPSDYVSIIIEFGDARGPIAIYDKSYILTQGTGLMQINAITPNELEVGKAKDIKLKLTTAQGLPITDATISIEEENGAPFNGDAPSSIIGDDSSELGQDGIYVFKRVKTYAPGTFKVIASKPKYRPTQAIITSTVANFFELSQPDLLQLSCNTNDTSQNLLKVKNTLDETINAEITIDPACATIKGPGVTPVQTALQPGQTAQDAIAKYRVVNWKSQKTIFMQLSPAKTGGQACTLEINAIDPRTNVRNKDTPLQIENTCAKTPTNATELKDAEAVIYINSNSFTPVRVVVDVFSYLRYGSYQPTSLWDSRYADAASYQSNPYGGQYAYANRINQYAGLSQPYPQYGLTGAAPNTYLQKGQQPIRIGAENVDTSGRFYGTAAFADASGQNTFIDVARQNDKRNYTIAFVNEDEVPHALKCKNRNGDTVLNVESIDASSTYVATIAKPGLYQCKLETGDTGTIKIKSMCPQKGALYYTRLITRCMARNALGETGLFDGGKQHAANIAASVNTRFVVYANKVSMGVVDDAKENAPKCKASSGEVSCQIKISPLIQQNGFAFSIEDATGEPNYRATYVQSESNVPLKQCTEIVNLDTESSYRALLSPVIDAVSTTGLTTPSKYTSWAIKFNPTGDCVKVRPVGSSTTMQAQIYNPQEDKFVGNGQLTFDLVSQNNPNIKLRVKLEIIPQDSAIDGRFLFTTIPTTGSLYYRTETAPKEPGFIVNNLPGEKVALGVAADKKTQDIVPANTLAVLTGNAPNSPDHYNTITDFAKGYYLCTENGGCNVKDGQAVQVKNFKLNPEDAKENEQITQVSSQLGDVIGNYKYDPSTSKEKTDAFKCSGTQYCSSESERKAVADANEQFAKAVKEQYSYVETINIDSAIENTGDALSGCIQEAMAEIVAQEAQYQLCKTLVNMCTGVGQFDPEEEEIEDGENFAGGLTLDAVLGDSQTIVKDIICQETEFGQNLQRLRDCLQPGNRQCRDLIASRIAGNLKQAKIKSVVSAVPVVDIKQPTVFFVTKRIQDVPSPDNTNLASEKHGGYNIYHFSYDEQQLLKQQTSDELFRVDPPGYDLSKYIAATASAPSQLVKSIVDWTTNDAVPINKARADALAQETSGFPYTTPKGTVVFDQFKPTLLTINKYPIARAFANVATEKETLYGEVEKTTNTCTINNRPADPLGLFDACEDLRGSAEQNEYDTTKPTEDKAPLSKSLVFLAVPNGIGETAGKPTWPLDWSEFKVTLTPQNELYAAGKTTRGVSAPYIAKIPVFGKALYPYAPSEEDLVIPKESAKDYAILVKGCKFTRDQNGETILDAKRPQCDQTTSLESISTYAAQCDAKSACAFITMQVDEKGRFLNIAALDGLDSHARGTNNVKIGEKDDEKTTIEELTRDLLRYYTDETYKAPELTKALAYKACTLQGNEKQAFLKCDKLLDAADNKLKIFVEKQRMATLSPQDDARFQLKLNSANELNFPQLNEATITTTDPAGKATTELVEQIGSFVATFDTTLNQELRPKLILNTLGHTTPNADGTVTNLDVALFTKLTGLKDPAITTWDKLNGQALLVMHVVYLKKTSVPAQIQLYSYDGKDLTWFYTIKGQEKTKVITASQIRNVLINAQTPQEIKDKTTHNLVPTTQDLQNGFTIPDAIQEMTFFSTPATTSIAIGFGEATKASKTEYAVVKDPLILGTGITDNVLVVKGQFLPQGTKLRVKFFKKPKLTEAQRSCEPANAENVACYDATFDPQPSGDPNVIELSVARLNLQGRKINVDYNFIRVILPADNPDGENKFIDTSGTLTNPKAEFASGDQNVYCNFNGKKVINQQCPNLEPKELKDLKKVPKKTKTAASAAATPAATTTQQNAANQLESTTSIPISEDDTRPLSFKEDELKVTAIDKTSEKIELLLKGTKLTNQHSVFLRPIDQSSAIALSRSAFQDGEIWSIDIAKLDPAKIYYLRITVDGADYALDNGLFLGYRKALAVTSADCRLETNLQLANCQIG